MSDFNYNDIIEYVDRTYDENFEKAKKWVSENSAQLKELVERRSLENGKLYRYFKIEKINYPTRDEIIKTEDYRIRELESKLAGSDYVGLKILEAIIKKDDTLLEELKNKYKSVLEDREKWRAELHNLLHKE